MKEGKYNGNKLDKISVLITDDHPLFRKAIRRLLGNIPFVEEVFEAENGKRAIEVLDSHKADIILLDLMMPVMNGEDTARIIRKRFPQCRIIILTMSDSKTQMIELLSMGVTGYVMKSTDEEELTNAIIDVREGSTYLSAEVNNVWKEFLDERVQQEMLKRSIPGEKNELSEREIEIVELICKQFNTKEIADKLNLSEHTVHTHRRNIMSKLDTDNVVGIAMYAVKYGIYRP